jgi:hypothetical protein
MNDMNIEQVEQMNDALKEMEREAAKAKRRRG